MSLIFCKVYEGSTINQTWWNLEFDWKSVTFEDEKTARWTNFEAAKR